MYNAAQTARLQTAVDAIPSCLFAEDMEDVTKRLAGTFRNVPKPGETLLSACAGLELVGKDLFSEGGDPPNAAHSMIAGLYCKGSDGYTRFLSAYATAFRAWDDDNQARFNEGNWAGDLIKGTKAFFRDVGGGLKDAAKGLGEAGGSIVWDSVKPLLPIIGGLLVAIVLIAFFTKGKISIK